MPFRLLPHLPRLFVAPAFRRGHLQICHCAPVGDVTDFRIFSQTTDKNDLVNATNCHDESPSVDVFSPHHLLSFGSRGFDVLRGPAFC
ncbi:hypothetical protein EC2846750_5060, partial [Escherichia coli 2846750]